MLRTTLGIVSLAGVLALLFALSGEDLWSSDTAVTHAAVPGETLAEPDAPLELVEPEPPEEPKARPKAERTPGPPAPKAAWMVAVEPAMPAGMPPDPLQAGNATLTLNVVERETGAAIPCDVFLWRLGAPENENWSAGDQLQCEIKVSRQGAKVHRVPEGLYRAICVSQRIDVEDPASFLVVAPRSDIVLQIDSAGRRHAYVEVFDEDGKRLERARLQRSGTLYDARELLRPDWLNLRTCKLESAAPLETEVESGRLFTHDRWIELRATKRGFDLGELPVDARDKRQRSTGRLAVPGRTEVAWSVLGEHTEGRDYVALSVEPAYVLRHLILPGGATCEGGDIDVAILGTALRRTGASPDALWRHAPITVEVTDPRYAPLTFEYRAADGPLEDRHLVPRKR